MANIPADLRYTEKHEYVKQVGDGSIVQVGITDYAQGELGDVVYVELPKVGAAFSRMDVFGNIEAVKAVSALYAPVAGPGPRGGSPPQGRRPPAARGPCAP